MKLAALLAVLARLAPYRGAIAAAGSVLLVILLAVLAIHLPNPAWRVYPVAGVGLVSFALGFLSPKPVLPPV